MGMMAHREIRLSSDTSRRGVSIPDAGRRDCLLQLPDAFCGNRRVAQNQEFEVAVVTENGEPGVGDSRSRQIEDLVFVQVGDCFQIGIPER